MLFLGEHLGRAAAAPVPLCCSLPHPHLQAPCTPSCLTARGQRSTRPGTDSGAWLPPLQLTEGDAAGQCAQTRLRPPCHGRAEDSKEPRAGQPATTRGAAGRGGTGSAGHLVARGPRGVCAIPSGVCAGPAP